MAVSPGIQDPTLNTAECVIEGHETDLEATGRDDYIKAMLGCSCSFTILFGPLLALITFIFFKKAENSGTGKKQNFAKAVKCVSCFLFFVEIGLLITVIVYSKLGNAPRGINVVQGLIFVEGLVMGLTLGQKHFDFLPKNKCNAEGVIKLGIFLWANLTTYHFCWLVIGIMVDTLWGFTVLLVICVVIAATVYSVYNFIHFYNVHSFILCGASLCSVLSLVVLVILAGQSFFGRETANEVVKTALLYVTTAFISWIFPKIKEEKPENQSNEGADERTPLNETGS